MVIGKFARAIYTQLKDIKVFGPSILLRGILPRDATGAVSIRTFIGSIALRPLDSDVKVLRQVFAQREYDLDRYPQGERVRAAYAAIISAGRTPVIVDAGANIGASSIWFAREFPRSRIIAVEPSPDNAVLCRRNCKRFDNIMIVEAAIGSAAGAVKLNNPEGAAWAVQTERDDSGHTRVATIQDLVSSLGDNFQLFIVKIDIEGFESDLFSSNTAWVSDSFVIIIEPHDWMLPGEHSSAFFQTAVLGQDFELLISGENLIFVR
jgi:FkbM family methyltransferase